MTKDDTTLFIIAPYLFGVINTTTEAADTAATTKANIQYKNNNNTVKDNTTVFITKPSTFRSGKQ